MFVVLARDPVGVRVRRFDDDAAPIGDELVESAADAVRRFERDRPRWVWDDSRRWYPPVLEAGLRVERALDLRLCRAILRSSALTAATAYATADRSDWDALPDPAAPAAVRRDALFELDEPSAPVELDPVAEWIAQREAAAVAPSLGLLLAAESVGALIACELEHAGLPFDTHALDVILTDLLGPRPRDGERPASLEALLASMRALVDDPGLNPDSPVELLKSLGRAGVRATSTRSWELKQIEHPVIEPLLEYKKLARLWTANGWSWADQWIADGRFRPGYVPGGVVTGRWAASGGGALQLPKQVRGAVVADPGWTFVVADAAQLEPRVLAAMARDEAMAGAGQGDLYSGIVESGAVPTRAKAKVAMLGAMYGATTGESGALLPSLRRAFPRAMRLVDDAARAGEQGGVVSTLLGRSSPRPDGSWARPRGEEGAADGGRARSWGRFTRNFVVQGTAAEWALSWMGLLRARLYELGSAEGSRPHLVFFLHDEVVVHTPVDQTDEVVAAVHDAAAGAARLLFGDTPMPFPVTAAVVDRYSDAK